MPTLPGARYSADRAMRSHRLTGSLPSLRASPTTRDTYRHIALTGLKLTRR